MLYISDYDIDKKMVEIIDTDDDSIQSVPVGEVLPLHKKLIRSGIEFYGVSESGIPDIVTGKYLAMLMLQRGLLRSPTDVNVVKYAMFTPGVQGGANRISTYVRDSVSSVVLRFLSEAGIVAGGRYVYGDFTFVIDAPKDSIDVGGKIGIRISNAPSVSVRLYIVRMEKDHFVDGAVTMRSLFGVVLPLNFDRDNLNAKECYGDEEVKAVLESKNYVWLGGNSVVEKSIVDYYLAPVRYAASEFLVRNRDRLTNLVACACSPSNPVNHLREFRNFGISPKKFYQEFGHYGVCYIYVGRTTPYFEETCSIRDLCQRIQRGYKLMKYLVLDGKLYIWLVAK